VIRGFGCLASHLAILVIEHLSNLMFRPQIRDIAAPILAIGDPKLALQTEAAYELACMVSARSLSACTWWEVDFSIGLIFECSIRFSS
jgi:hypothetical protein